VHQIGFQVLQFALKINIITIFSNHCHGFKFWNTELLQLRDVVCEFLLGLRKIALSSSLLGVLVDLGALL
jgi:hypothetical protein